MTKQQSNDKGNPLKDSASVNDHSHHSSLQLINPNDAATESVITETSNDQKGGLEPNSSQERTPEENNKLLRPTHSTRSSPSNMDALRLLLKTVQKVNFNQKAKVPDEGKPSRNHYRVVTINELLEKAHNDNWHLCLRHDIIYVFNGQYWSEIENNIMRVFLGKVALIMGVPPMIAKDYKFKDELFNQFKSDANLILPERDNSEVLINLSNGTFVFSSTGNQLKRFDATDFLTYQLPFAYDGNAEAPMFKAYLDRVLPDLDCQKVLAEYSAYIFTRGLKMEKTLMLYGDGANGKSVFHDILSALIGPDNCSNYSLGSLTKDPSYRAKLENKLLNYGTEISDKLDNNIYKQLVSGEPVEARHLYGSPFTLKHYAKLVFNGNDLPRSVEHSWAYFRRLLIIPFTQTIPEEEQDKELAAKIIREELPGVFNWILGGMDRLTRQKAFSPCAACDMIVARYREESDSVAMFLKEKSYQPSVKHHAPFNEFYTFYKVFCLEDGYFPFGKKNFKKRLESHKYHLKRLNTGNVIYAEIKQPTSDEHGNTV